MRRIQRFGIISVIGFAVLGSSSSPSSLWAADNDKELKKTPATANVSVPNAAPSATIGTNSTAKATTIDKALNQEILQVLQSKYADPALLTSKKINQAAIQGILNSLDNSALLLDAAAIAKPDVSHPAISDGVVLQPAIGYVRCERLDEGAVKQLDSEIQKMIKEKQISGLILDMRFAQGSDFHAIPSAASLFLASPTPLFEIQRNNGIEKFASAHIAAPTDLPLTILIGSETREAPETFAAVMQDQGRALVIGDSDSSGEGFETMDIKLTNGQILRLATGKVRLSRGTDLFLKGMKPDVKVVMDVQLEKQIYNKPFVPPEFKPDAPLFSEAILTGRTNPPLLTKEKDKKESENPPTNDDMVLLRAMDLLKTIQNLGLTTSEPPFTGAFNGTKG